MELSNGEVIFHEEIDSMKALFKGFAIPINDSEFIQEAMNHDFLHGGISGGG